TAGAAVIRSSRAMAPPSRSRRGDRLEIGRLDHLSHRNEDLALALERAARMRDEHVVEGDHVAGLPGRLDAELLVHLADAVDDLVRDRRAVAEVDVARHVLLREQLAERR